MVVAARGRKQLCRRGGRGLDTVTGMHRRRAPSSPGRDRHEKSKIVFSKPTISRFSDQISRSSCLLKNHSCLFDISSKPRSWLPRGPERVQRRGARGGCRLRHNRKAAGRACMTRAEKKTRFLTAVHFPSPDVLPTIQSAYGLAPACRIFLLHIAPFVVYLQCIERRWMNGSSGEEGVRSDLEIVLPSRASTTSQTEVMAPRGPERVPNRRSARWGCRPWHKHEAAVQRRRRPGRACANKYYQDKQEREVEYADVQ